MADAQRPALVDGLNKQFAAAFESRDFASVAAIFTSDAVMLPPRRSLVSGRDKIQSYWSRANRVKDIKFESDTITALADDVTRDIGTLRMRVEPGRARREGAAASQQGGEGGPQARELAGKYVFVWRKVDGEWQLETSIWNVNSPGRNRPVRAGRSGGGRRRNRE